MNRRALRFAFLAALAGGLVLWAHLRTPRDLRLDVDLTSVMPGDIAEVDVIVRRDGHALARFDQRYRRTGAPAMVSVPVRATAGPAEVETTLVTSSGTSRRVRSDVTLSRDTPAIVMIDH